MLADKGQRKHTARMNYDAQLRIFRKSLPEQIRLREISRLLGDTDKLDCLDAGPGNAVASKTLRRRGGTWSTTTITERARSQVLDAVGERVVLLDGPILPFDDKSFDVIVISDLLERMPDDNEFISECHRVLRPGGNLVLNTPHNKHLSILPGIASIAGLSPEQRGCVRQGYTEQEIFQLLKHGFDVHTIRSCLRGFIRFVDIIVQAQKLNIDSDDEIRLTKLYSTAFPFYFVAFQLLDMMLLFTKGHDLIVMAKRHAWRPREAPVLNDGRTISEAVLSKIRD